MLIVVLRYRMGQWQRSKASKSVTERTNSEPDTTQHQENIVAPVTPPETGEESWTIVDPVEAMIEGVKSRGVRFIFLQNTRTLMSLMTCALDRGVN